MATSNVFNSMSFSSFDMGAMMKMNDIGPSVQKDLQKVYLLLTVTIISAAMGCYLNYYLPLGGILTMLGAIGMIFLISKDRGNPTLKLDRMLYLCAFGALKGMSIGPLVILPKSPQNLKVCCE